ncbi:MAG: carbon-nitrogen hydrolase family protein [Deltaproteobacteria bacterium]|nr:carbon-nitrogen hydrolase family protein [Deltaproteobacteria bacterium]
MRVAAVQFKARLGDLDGSRLALAELARDAAAGADLVVLPEMAATGYLFDDVAHARTVAERPDGPTLALLAPIARDAGCWIVCGFPEDAGRRLYNSALVIDDTGALRFVYRKTLLYEPDERWAHPGDSGYRAFETAAGSFGVGICMDLNDDEFLAWCHDASPRVIAFPTNWLDEGFAVWRYWAWRLAGLEATLVAANSWGVEGDIVFSGASAVLTSHEVYAVAPVRGDTVVRAVVGQHPPRLGGTRRRARMG